jgi:hypothetical protein
VALLVQLLLGSDVAHVVALTARSEEWRGHTYKWLLEHGLPLDTVLMRPANNFEPNTKVKPDLLNAWLQEYGLGLGAVLFIVDDNDKMVETWRNMGFRCWQVAPGGK